MQKAVTLFPRYITADSGFGGILSANGTGEDYRTLAKKDHDKDGDGLYVGIIGFSNTPLIDCSTACRLNSFTLNYRQRSDPDYGSGAGGQMRHYPQVVTAYSVDGALLTPKALFGVEHGFGSFQYTNDDGKDSWQNKSCTLFTGNESSIIGYNIMLADKLYIRQRSPYVVKQKAYMSNLTATVVYTARYYARFHDENARALERQTVEGGTAPTVTPEILEACEKEGYNIIGWEDRINNPGVVYPTPPVGVDRDIYLYPVYEIKKHRISMPYLGNNTSTIAVQIYNKETQEFEAVSKYVDLTTNRAYLDIEYGKRVRLIAYNVNADYSEDVVVYFDNSTTGTTFNGSRSNYIEIFQTNKLVDDVYISKIEAEKVYKNITTSCNTGGEITPTAKIPRSYEYSIDITPYVGYEISKITKNGEEIAVANKSKMTISGKADNDSSFVATFSRIKIPVIFNHDEKITVTGETNVNYGELNKWTITAADGYSINQIKIGDEIILDAFKKAETYELSRVCVEPITVDITTTNNFVTVTAETCENGTIIGDIGTYIKGKGTLSFEAKPKVGYRFLAWTGVDWTTQTYELDTATAEDSYTLGATFEECAYQIRVTIRGNGTVEQSAEYVSYGESVTLKAIPDEGWHFDSWSVMRNGEYSELYTASTEEITIDYIQSFVDVLVEFKISQFDFVTSVSSSDGAGVGGVINGSDKTKYDYHTELNLEAVPDEGYYFVKWSDDVFNPKRTYVIPAENTALTAYFERYKYKVTVEGDKSKIELTANGATTENEATVKYGDDLQLLITPDFGYRISDVLLNSVSIKEKFTTTLKNSRCIFQKITANYDIKVIFEEKMYTNGRRLIDYYPPVIAAIKDMQQIVKGQQPLINGLWDAISFVTENQFIDTATEEGVKQWENELGIVPSSAETLNQRKKRLKNKWVPDNRFTMIWLYDWLKQVSERNDLRKPTVKDYVLTVTLPAIVDYLSIFADLENYKPANIKLDSVVSLEDGVHNLNSGIGIITTISSKIEREVETVEN